MRGLIGYTGFVGGNLDRQVEFEHRFNSENIDSIRGKTYELVACAGAPGQKWLANKDPESDRCSIERLTSALGEISAGRFVLISTIDVYPLPQHVDETTPIDPDEMHPYGRHRFELEEFVKSRFDDLLILRLPGLFGPGLRKNAIYDLIHDNQVDRIDPRSIFQFYDVGRLWKDAELAFRHGIELLNVATEPVCIGDMARDVFNRRLSEPEKSRPATYDFRSIHSEHWGGAEGYLYTRGEVMEGISRFVADWKR